MSIVNAIARIFANYNQQDYLVTRCDRRLMRVCPERELLRPSHRQQQQSHHTSFLYSASWCKCQSQAAIRMEC